jgi:glycosyltransferase involved in cell wall biosynthesis
LVRRREHEHSVNGSSQKPSPFVLICFSHLRWNFVFQRPQHLMVRAAREHQVFFFEEPVFEQVEKPRLDLHNDASGVVVAVPILPADIGISEITAAQRMLVDELVAAFPSDRLIAWYYTPMALTFSAHLQPSLCVYDNMDELSLFAGAPRELLELEKQLLSRAGVVFTGGQSLYEAKRGRHANLHAFPSSIDAQHFARARQTDAPSPPDQAGIASPRVGFFGVIDERMDLVLVDELAQRRAQWQLVMIGPVVKIDPAKLPRRPNIHWVGPKTYSDLPRYLAGWDLGIMPFAVNEATRFISPTKTPEFLAAGVRVVSTRIMDVVRPYGDAGLVEIADNADAFVAKIEILLNARDPDWLVRVDRHLALLSWDKTWRGMSRLMMRAAQAADLDELSTQLQGA